MAATFAVLALAAWPGMLRADDGQLAAASRPFSLGEVALERAVDVALRTGRFECVGTDCFEVSSRLTLVAWDISVAVPIARDAAVFILQPILFRSGGGDMAQSHKFPGALTLGVRHVGSAGPALELAAAVSLSLSFPASGGQAEVTTKAAGRMIDDRSLYQAGLGTLRVELDARRQLAPAFVQAQLLLAAQSNERQLLANGRAGLGAGVQLSTWAAVLAELTTQLATGDVACHRCGETPGWEGPRRPALSVGGRVALGAWRLGARVFLPLTDADGLPRAPSLTATAGARF